MSECKHQLAPDKHGHRVDHTARLVWSGVEAEAYSHREERFRVQPVPTRAPRPCRHRARPVEVKPPCHRVASSSQPPTNSIGSTENVRNDCRTETAAIARAKAEVHPPAVRPPGWQPYASMSTSSPAPGNTNMNIRILRRKRCRTMIRKIRTESQIENWTLFGVLFGDAVATPRVSLLYRSLCGALNALIA